MRRIVLVGCAGSGKSTLAQQLGAILDLEVVHLDALYWKPNWAKTPEDQWQETVKALLKKESWILDGNFSSSRGLRFEAADTIFFWISRVICVCFVSSSGISGFAPQLGAIEPKVVKNNSTHI